jgi:hypothetical protein
MDSEKKIKAKNSVKNTIGHLPLSEQIIVLESLSKDIRKENSIRINRLVEKLRSFG